MTGPGLPSSPLPEGVLQAHQLGSALQGLNATKVGDTAEARLPEVFTGTLGGELVNAPIKYVLGLFAEFLGDIVDDGTPAITGPDELQDRIHDFFEDLPLVGIFVSIADAMLGNYDGDDPALLAVQDLFALLRKLLELVSGVSGDLPELGDIISGFEDLASAVGGLIEGLFKIPIWQVTNEAREVIDRFDGLSTVDEVEGWSWDETDGHDHDGCALFTATGTPGVLLSPTPVEVREGEEYTLSGWVKATGASGGGIELGVQWYDAEHVALSTSTAQTVGSPASSWTELSGTVTVPAGAKYARRMLRCENTVGEVRWDDVRFKGEATSIAQDWVTGLPGALADLGDWIESLVDQLLGALGVPSLGTLFDKISDLSDEVESWLGDTQDRAADLLNLIDDLWSSPSSVIGSIPQALVSGLDTTLNQIRDVFDGLVVTPVNSVVGAIKDWFDQWFGGGSGNAIPLSQKGAASGVAPLNSSSKLATSFLETNVNNGVAGLNSSGKIATSLLVTDSANNVPTLDGSGKIQSGHLPSMNYIPTGDKGAVNGVAPLNSDAVVPLANLPAEVGGTGGTGSGLPYVNLYLASDVSIANNTTTYLTAWAQSGTASVTFEDGTNTRWKFSLPGLWQIGVCVGWNTGTTGNRMVWVEREADLGGSAFPMGALASCAAAGLQTPGGAAGLGCVYLNTQHHVAAYSVGSPFGTITLADDDWFKVGVRHTQGSALNVLGAGIAVPFNTQTIVTCTYLGAA